MRKGLTALLLLCGLSCIDVQEGKNGFYYDPCTGLWRAALECGRETGGADPARSTPGGGTAAAPDTGPTCQEVCDFINQCFGGTATPDELAQCVTQCEQESTADQRECLIMDCDFEGCLPAQPVMGAGG